MVLFGLYSHFLKLWDYRNKHIRFEEVDIMKNGLDLLIEAFVEECENAKKNNFNNADDTTVLEKVEKYQRQTQNNEER